MARELLEALDQAGVRLTGPRRELAALIARRTGHFTAADLLADAEQRSLGIGRATVFRLLEKWTRCCRPFVKKRITQAWNYSSIFQPLPFKHFSISSHQTPLSTP